MVDIPKIKRKIIDFLSKEDGKISKDALLKAGLLAGATIFASAMAGAQTAHSNTLNAPSYSSPTASVSHSHHASHSSHGSHGSHSSHGSHGSHSSHGSHGSHSSY